ncbi:MAG TPA: hypothetical protein VGW39_06670 [Chthoniobacterales bacterium]|nr:hypothetical protein [Chthoniobacterales bacterium]
MSQLGVDLKKRCVQDRRLQFVCVALCFPCHVHRQTKPVLVKGVPYTLYPIYGVRGVSLYYITS